MSDPRTLVRNIAYEMLSAQDKLSVDNASKLYDQSVRGIFLAGIAIGMYPEESNSLSMYEHSLSICEFLIERLIELEIAGRFGKSLYTVGGQEDESIRNHH